MSNRVRELFGLDPEYNKRMEESIREAQEKAVREKWCCTCEYYIVTAYPECEKGRNPVQTCEDYRTAGCAIRNSPWADRIRERFMRKE